MCGSEMDIVQREIIHSYRIKKNCQIVLYSYRERSFTHIKKKNCQIISYMGFGVRKRGIKETRQSDVSA